MGFLIYLRSLRLWEELKVPRRRWEGRNAAVTLGQVDAYLVVPVDVHLGSFSLLHIEYPGMCFEWLI